jgi:hypothetical protein
MTNTMRHFLFTLSLFLSFSLLPLHAHVGSSGVIVQRQAGNYQLLVSVQPPDVVPGTAQVTVFVEKGNPTRVQGRPVYFFEGDEGAPEADPLTRTADGPYKGAIWFMESGSTSIQLLLDGPDGKATVVVPVVATSTATRDMPAGTGMGLALMGLFLFGVLVTILGASNADGVTLPGHVPSNTRRIVGSVIGAVLLAGILYGGRMWWNSWADEYRTYKLYRPVPLFSTARPEADGQVLLTMRPDTTGFANNRNYRRNFNLLVPDHGKLMHTFVVRMPTLDAFAHIHPTRRDSLHFEARLPTLPAGRYLLYTDVVYRTGYAETLTDTVDIPAPARAANVPRAASQRTQPGPVGRSGGTADLDDSYLLAAPMGVKKEAIGQLHLDNDMVACGKPSASTPLPDGSTMLWTDKPAPILQAGELYTLKFAVADPTGKAAKLEPYLGMAGHAAILRSDGTVYIHLHPVGTYSMASETAMLARMADTTRKAPRPNDARFRDSIDTYLSQLRTQPATGQYTALAPPMAGMGHTANSPANMVTFPYAFPRPGHYRIWVQVKRNGQVLTGAFDTQVKE